MTSIEQLFGSTKKAKQFLDAYNIYKGEADKYIIKRVIISGLLLGLTLPFLIGNKIDSWVYEYQYVEDLGDFGLWISSNNFDQILHAGLFVIALFFISAMINSWIITGDRNGLYTYLLEKGHDRDLKWLTSDFDELVIPDLRKCVKSHEEVGNLGLCEVTISYHKELNTVTFKTESKQISATLIMIISGIIIFIMYKTLT